MADIIRVFDFVVNFQEDKFERKDGNTDVITIVESDNKSTKFKFYFEEELQDGTNVLVKIKHNIGFAKDYVLCIKNKEAELVLTNSITIAGFLKMTISFIGNDNEILTPAQFQNKILVKEAITGETPIPEDDSKLLEGLISQVNLLNDDAKKAVEGIENTFDQINKKLDEKIETINERDNEQDGKITLNKESIKQIQAENERLREDIKSIATIGEASGENIHLEDSSDARCEIEICGNQEQETRDGYNQFKITSTLTQGADVTITKIDESSVSYQGTTTGMFTHMLVEYDGNGLEITKQMYLKAFGNLTNAILSVKLIKNGETESRYLRCSPDLVLNVGDILQQVYVQQKNVGILVSGTLQVLLTDYENKDKPYEQYGASPSIPYPSEAKSVGDNVNLFPGWEMGTIDVATGNKVTDTYYIRSVDFIPILPNIDYTIYSINSFGFNSLNTALRLYDKDKKYLGNQYLGEILEKNLTFKITNLDARFMIPTSTNGQKNKIPGNAKVDIKLEKGIIATPYSSYNCGSTKVDIKNENIFNTENVKSTSEVSVVDNKNGVLELQGVNGFWKGITTTQKFETGKRVYVKCKVVEGTGSSGNIGIKDTNGDDILENYKVSNNLISCSFIPKGITNIFFRCNAKSNTGHIKYTDIMFSYEDIDYVPNQEQSYLLDVQQEMLEGDYLDLENEKEHHEWGKYIFTGDEDYNKSQTYSNEKYFCGYIPTPVATNIKVDGKGICNYFNNFGDYVQITDKECIRIWGQFQVRILASHLTENSAEAFKAWLKSKYDEGNPVVVYYQLETPIELDFTNRQKLIAKQIKSEAHTYKNITNISAESAEVNPIVNVKYLKDTETEHNKLQAQIDEIKELLSTTETSSLLLDNIQKDLESEV